MKHQPFYKRLQYALAGIRSGFSERSFRTQIFFAISAFAALVVVRPAPLWWASIAIISAAILAAELFNTALESVIDHLHPEKHRMMGRAKDCAAAGVLILSVAAIMVFMAMIYDTYLLP